MTITDKRSIDANSNEFAPNIMSMITFKSWSDQFQLIHHLVLYSNILMIVQGKKSSGKTTYLKGLVDKLPQEFSCKTIHASQIETKEALELCLRQLFSLNSLTGTEGQEKFSLMEQMRQGKKHCLLMIDDAHLLSDDVITAVLTYLQSQDNDAYFHCLLMGDPMLTAKFSQPPLESCRESFTHIIDLPELDLLDAKAFLNRKFSSLGTEQISSMTDEHLQSLIKKSDGNLSILSELAHTKLGGAEKTHSLIPASPIMFKYKKAGVATMAGLMCLMIFASVRTPTSSLHNTQQLALPTPSIRTLLDTKQTVENDTSKERLFEGRPRLSQTIELTEQKRFKKRGGYVPMSMIPNYKLLSKRVNKKDEAKIIAANNAFELATKRKGDGLKKNISLGKTAPVNTKPSLRVATKAPMANTAHTKKHVAKPLVKVSGKSVSNRIAVRQQPRHSNSTRLGKGYGIQLAASSNMASLKRYARKYHVHSQARYYTATKKGKRWYMLVLGDYDSKAQASKAKTSLPEKIKNKKPWLRSIKGLKEVK